ncbi:MAG: heparinase II/III family protein [Armatimonadota bacterium]
MSLRMIWAIVLVLLGSAALAAAPHPRIFITAEDIPRLRAMAQQTQENALGVIPADAWAEIVAKADRLAGAGPYHYRVNMPGREGGPSKIWEYTLSDELPPRHDDYSHYPPWTAMFQERGDSITTRLKYFLLAYVVTGEDKYFLKAKEIVFHLCAWDLPLWHDPSTGNRPSLDTSHCAEWVGIFYDWCYDDLSEDERRTVRENLISKALVHADEHLDNMSVYHNITVTVAMGLAMGSIAVLDEEPRAEGWLRHALERLKLNFDAQGDDGGAMEGPGYGTYATDNFSDVIWALGTAGIDHDLLDHPYIQTMPRYCISLLDPGTNQQPCFGDGGPRQGFGRLNLALALQGDTDAAWYCRQIGMFDDVTPRTFIGMDPARVQPEAPAFNPSDAFIDIGYGILRDGFHAESAFMAFKCGPPTSRIGHNHYDHNSFMLSYNGVWIGWDPGYRSYFNPPIRKYTVGTIGHSTIVVDLDDEYLADYTVSNPGHDQMNLAGGRMEEFFTSDHFDYVLGEAADTYNTDEMTVLERFDRQIVFAKPRVFFVRDSLQAPQPHTYSALFHLDGSGSFEITGSSANGCGSSTLLQIHPFSPDGITLKSGVYEGAESKGPYLAATTGRTEAATITTVLVPRESSQLLTNTGFENGMGGWTPRTAEGQRPNHVIDTEIKHSGRASGRIDNNGYYYTNRFSLPPGTEVTFRWWAKCTASEGASSIFYHSHNGTSVKRTHGPAADVNEWRQYELTDVIPEGATQSVLALQFFGEGQCWYDDLEIEVEPEPETDQPASVTPIEDGAGGAVVEVDGETYIMICGTPGEPSTQRVDDHVIETDAEIAVVRMGAEQTRAFMLRGTTFTLDGVQLRPEAGEWKAGPVR